MRIAGVSGWTKHRRVGLSPNESGVHGPVEDERPGRSPVLYRYLCDLAHCEPSSAVWAVNDKEIESAAGDTDSSKGTGERAGQGAN